MEVYRTENKFVIGQEEYYRLSFNIGQLLREDSHNGAGGYTVHSVYFDTPYARDYLDKLNGLELRRKIRLRWYGESADRVKLELKQKQGSNQLKRSVIVPGETAKALLAGNYTPLLDEDDDFTAELYAIMKTYAYRPKILIDYRRKAFTADGNNTRITFDRQVCASLCGSNVLREKKCGIPVISESDIIMEVKYNGFLLSYIKEMLSMTSSEQLSVSKYCLAAGKLYL